MAAGDRRLHAVRTGAAVTCAATLVLWLVPLQSFTLLSRRTSCRPNPQCQCARRRGTCHCRHKPTKGWEATEPSCCGRPTALTSAAPAAIPRSNTVERAILERAERLPIVVMPGAPPEAIPSQRGPPDLLLA